MRCNRARYLERVVARCLGSFLLAMLVVFAAAAPPPASAASTLPKNSAAIRLLTDPSIRWPTPPSIPPTTASAS